MRDPLRPNSPPCPGCRCGCRPRSTSPRSRRFAESALGRLAPQCAAGTASGFDEPRTRNVEPPNSEPATVNSRRVAEARRGHLANLAVVLWLRVNTGPRWDLSSTLGAASQAVNWSGGQAFHITPISGSRETAGAPRARWTKSASANRRERGDVLRGRQPHRQPGDGGEFRRSGSRIAYAATWRTMRLPASSSRFAEAALVRLARRASDQNVGKYGVRYCAMIVKRPVKISTPTITMRMPDTTSMV